MRPDQHPHPGQAARPAVVRASTRTTVSISSTDSTNTPSTEENSSSFNCGEQARPHCSHGTGDLLRTHTSCRQT